MCYVCQLAKLGRRRSITYFLAAILLSFGLGRPALAWSKLAYGKTGSAGRRANFEQGAAQQTIVTPARGSLDANIQAWEALSREQRAAQCEAEFGDLFQGIHADLERWKGPGISAGVSAAPLYETCSQMHQRY
jgi:hypothetical protein